MNFTFKHDMTFNELIALVITSEGGYSSNPADKGGPTKFGVAWNFNTDWLKLNLGYKVGTDLKKLTLDQAKQCYYERYWLPSHSNGISDLDLAYIHLDTAINLGIGGASTMLGKLSKNPKFYDGSKGKNRVLFMGLFLEYVAIRLSFYTHARDRADFLDGWVNRIVFVINKSLEIGE